MNALTMPVELDRTKMLFWRLDLVRRSFVTLNRCRVGVLGRENYRFFKDRDYRETLLYPDDRAQLEKAFSDFRERTPVELIFRVYCDETVHWYKLKGWPADSGHHYDGSVEDIGEYVTYLQNIFDRQCQRLLDVEADSYPVALFRADRGWRFRKANAPFAQLIPAPGDSCLLHELLERDTHCARILEQLVTERRVQAEMVLAAADGQLLKAFCRLESFRCDNQDFVRLAVLSGVERKKSETGGLGVARDDGELRQLCDALGRCGSIGEMLESIYRSRTLLPGMDVVMFSDIYARKNKVIVYSKGELDEPLEQGTKFPYAGTIAENIEKEKLDYLIVDDTQSSIKAIDWMLFVPKGLYSYIAKALYVRGAMRTVLILCSRSKNVFSEDQAAVVEQIARAFHRRLKQLRRKAG